MTVRFHGQCVRKTKIEIETSLKCSMAVRGQVETENIRTDACTFECMQAHIANSVSMKEVEMSPSCGR